MIAQNGDGQQPQIHGRWLILAVAAIAIAMTLFAWFYWYGLGDRIQSRLGTDLALLIHQAPDVEVLRLIESEGATPAETVTLGDRTFTVIEKRDLMHPPAPGWSHVRTLLLRDAAYEWSEPLNRCQPQWQYGLRFRDASRQAVVLISVDCPRLALASVADLRGANGSWVVSPRSDKPLSIRPIAPGLAQFVQEQLRSKASPRPKVQRSGRFPKRGVPFFNFLTSSNFFLYTSCAWSLI